MFERVSAAAAAVMVMCVGTVARAADPPAEVSEQAASAEPVDRPWGVLLEVALGGALAGPIAGSAGLGGLGPAPVLLGATLEYRVADELFVMLDVRGSLARSVSDDLALFDTRLIGAAGLRHALTSPEILEVSWYGALRGGYGEARYDEAVAASALCGAEVGLTLDKGFTDWFGIRVRTSVVTLDYARYTGDAASAPATTEAFSASVGLAPHFALRFAF